MTHRTALRGDELPPVTARVRLCGVLFALAPVLVLIAAVALFAGIETP